jgi:tRNA(Arg) A34 adenosine deaminase TadA
MSSEDPGFKAALQEACQGSREGGVPIGAALVSAEGKILGQGHNMRIQKCSATLHVRANLQPCYTDHRGYHLTQTRPRYRRLRLPDVFLLRLIVVPPCTPL